MLGLDLARLLRLPFKVIEESLGFLKDEKCVEVLGGDLIGRISYRFNLTELGRSRAQEAMKLCAYVGPAPVPLEDYVEQTYRQAVTGIDVQPRAAAGRVRASGHQRRAVQRHRPGHRQRQVGVHLRPARQRQDRRSPSAIGDFMNNAGGEIYVPYAFLAENSIITLYDQAVHQRTEDDAADRMEDNEATIRRLLNSGTVDARWVQASIGPSSSPAAN